MLCSPPNSNAAMNSRKFLRVVQIAASRGCAALGLIVLNYVVGKLWGDQMIGRVSTVLSIAVGGGVLSRIGLDLLAIRQIGAAQHIGDRTAVRNYFWSSAAVVLCLGFFVSLCVFLAKEVISDFFSLRRSDVLSVALLIVPVAISSLVASSLRAVGAPARGQLLEIGGFALSASASCALVYKFIDTEFNVLLMLGSAAAVFFFMLLMGALSAFGKPTLVMILDGGGRLYESAFRALTLYLFAVMQYLAQWAGVLIAAAMLSAGDVAVVSVSQRYSMVIFLLLGTVAGVMAPKYAGMFAVGDIASIERKEGRIRSLLISAVLPLFVLIVIFAEQLLGVFGVVATSEAKAVLILLAFAQVVNVAAGCSAHMLAAFGQEAAMLRIGFAGVVVGLTTSAFAGMQFGVVGLAVGQLLGITVPALLSLFGVKQVLSNTKSAVG